MGRRLFASEGASLIRARLLADSRTRSGGFGTHPLARERRLLADSLRIPGRISMDSLPISGSVVLVSETTTSQGAETMTTSNRCAVHDLDRCPVCFTPPFEDDRMEIRIFRIPSESETFSALGDTHWIVNRVTWDGRWLGNIANGWSNAAEAVEVAKIYAAAIRPELYARWVEPGCSDTLAEAIVAQAMSRRIHSATTPF